MGHCNTNPAVEDETVLAVTHISICEFLLWPILRFNKRSQTTNEDWLSLIEHPWSKLGTQPRTTKPNMAHMQVVNVICVKSHVKRT